MTLRNFLSRLAECIVSVELNEQGQLEEDCRPIVDEYVASAREAGYRQGVESCCQRVCDRCRNPNDNPPATFRYGRWLHGDWACTASTIRGIPEEHCAR